MPTTNMLLAGRGLQMILGADAREWAIEQLVAGRDFRHLRQLAGTTDADDRAEMDALFDRCRVHGM